MDELINKYAEILKNAKVGDYTYQGILGAFAREIKALESDSKALNKPTDGPGTNTGHGHVWPRPDGVKARCGGFPKCNVCVSDYDAYKGPEIFFFT